MKNKPTPLRFLAAAYKDYTAFPGEVQKKMGRALAEVQFGTKPTAAKPLTGLGSGVLEVRSDFDGDTFRAVYTVRLAGAVYVVHAFQKKSKSGIATPKHEIDLIRARLKQAEEHHAKHPPEPPPGA
jgi:phage-related protein